MEVCRSSFCIRSVIPSFRPVDLSRPAAASVRASLYFSRNTAFHHASPSLLSLYRLSDPVTRHRRRKQVIFAVFERFTERAIKAVVFSQKEARALGKEMVFPQHILLGLIAEDRSREGFLGSGITIDRARDAVIKIWNSSPVAADESAPGSLGSSTDTPFSASSKRVLEAAVELSKTMGSNFIAPEHIAVGLITADDGSSELVLRRLGAEMNTLVSLALLRLQGELSKDGRQPTSTFSKVQANSHGRKSAVMKSLNKMKESHGFPAPNKSMLAQFCVDLTAQATVGHIDPVIGREVEIQRVIQILCRRTKNNPILLGEAGVGKTAIAEGLALRISCGDIPVFLAGKRMMSMDIGLLMAGSKERGELEARVTGLVAEVQKAGDVILFIDEVHTLIGSGTVGRGNKGSGLDISNLLKPALGRGELQCIASTTLNEYRIHFEKDKALARRFQPVLINEPSQEDAVKILMGVREKYENYHKCRFTIEAINAAVYLSTRYIADRHLPDKAIDLIDEAGSRARMDAHKKKKENKTSILSKAPDEYWQEIRVVEAMQRAALSDNQKITPTMSSSDDLDLANNANNGSKLSAPSLPEQESVIVGPEEIATVASLWSGIPVKQLTDDEMKLLAGLDEELKKRVIGQDDAVSVLSRALKRSRVGIKDPGRPIAALLFCGPTGVGKTELTKALAASYFGSESAMLRLDMSEYMERFAVSKLIGSPPGYIGYEDGGTLTEAVRRRPFSVILLDEIEKAHPDIFNILLQIFEDGHLTDSQGRRVSFKNTLIVMTSNLGSTSMSRGRRSLGFMLRDDSESNSYAAMKSLVMEELKAYFRPELLNRIDEVIVFQPLKKEQMMEILDILLKEVKGRILALGIGLQVTDAVKDLVCKQGYDKGYGARPLRRAVTHFIEDVISEALLAGDYKPGETILLDLDASGNPFVSCFTDQTMLLSSDASSKV
ncbi:Chaperone protein ClpD2, chloroplastic [Apostasia shenzhenica]|uniref:Chaperone protein ClpD2, chloroplastic n=1 Tax=Apostasia shenzhenica TaxID=1088818 RepID=A0A2I0AN15_9ASPA|nr:Chaperone protein ClpD2, chloroplastic [Apostasia shenzhenica]